MLLNDFFKITTLKNATECELIAEIELNPNHKIYKGHFPGNPVVPGVVSVQMINEILSEHLKIKLMTSKARSIKFTSMINPKANPNLIFKINYSVTEDKNYKVIAQIFFEETVFLKFNGILSYEFSSSL